MKLVIFGLTISSSWGNGHAPQVPEEFAEFCARMVRRYAPASSTGEKTKTKTLKPQEILS